MRKIELLDCTLRDGAYIVNGNFGEHQLVGIIEKLQKANVDVIECGWLKDIQHESGSSYFHIPSDLKPYLKDKTKKIAAMIDYNRYNDDELPENTGDFIDIIRVVFPRGQVKAGVEIASRIREKGYEIYFQIANTPGYSDAELLELVEQMNEFRPVALSIVDTFGVLAQNDLERILSLVDNNLDKRIKLGFHSHNNQQMSYALSISFVEWLCSHSERDIIVDSSMMGMGRGAGNACTELVTNYLNTRHHKKYDLSEVMDCIDLYINDYSKSYQWGYSVQYALAGIYGCHVNNVAYLNDTHRIKNKDMLNVFEKMGKAKRIEYDYDNLEKQYVECVSREIDDSELLKTLKQEISDKAVVLVLPGKSAEQEYANLDQTMLKDSYVIGVNSVLNNYKYDMVFFTNEKKLDYYKDAIGKDDILTLATSNISKQLEDVHYNSVNYNSLIKGEWKYRDNSAIIMLRLLDKLGVKNIGFIGFDGYSDGKVNYANSTLRPNVSSESELLILQNDIEEMLRDFVMSYKGDIKFITNSCFEQCIL